VIGLLREQARAGFKLATSYRLSFALGLSARWWALVWVYFLAKLVPADATLSPELAQGYLAFALVGVAVEQHLHFVLQAFSEKLREDELNGLVPALLATPAPPAAALFGPLLWGILERSVTLLLMLGAAALAFGVSFAGGNWLGALLAFALATGAVAAWGVLSACFTLVFKRGDPVLWFSDTLGFVFSGALIPLSVLPAPMRWVAAAYPHAHAVSALRNALLRGSGFGELAPGLLALGGFAIVLLPLSFWALGRAIHRVREAGTIGFY
jgi:ABC-2 type transport system permease protein